MFNRSSEKCVAEAVKDPAAWGRKMARSFLGYSLLIVLMIALVILESWYLGHRMVHSVSRRPIAALFFLVTNGYVLYALGSVLRVLFSARRSLHEFDTRMAEMQSSQKTGP